MKKIFKGLICAGLAGAMAVGVVGAAGCKKSSGRDPESDPLRLAIGAVDEKFNPLFYTSQNDGTIANLTQVGLITSDTDGNLAVGEDQPTVALRYAETYYNKAGTKIGTGDGIDVNYLQGYTEADTEGSTTYEFLIKNGMKFSDGVDLTVMDVLFNLYVYLDPLYSGSNTIYSTKIKGLQAYRQNDPNAGEESTSSTSTYRIAAQDRIKRLIEWSDGTNSGELTAEQEQDLAKVKELYKEELTTDWNSTVTGWVEQYKDYYFTEAWQAYYFYEGVVKEQQKVNDKGKPARFKDDNGKYPTDLDPDWQTGEISQGGKLMIADMEEAASDAKIDEHIANNPGTSRENAKLELQKRFAIEYIYSAYTKKETIHNVLKYNATAGTALEYFMQDEMSKAAESTEQEVFKISGIQVYHTADARHNGKFLESDDFTYEEDHDILKITISGVDPKAKWNFGFTVAPMHYYSGTYNNVNYVKLAMDDYEAGLVYENDGTDQHVPSTNFGVKYSDVNFTNSVLAAAGKNGVPVGAGAYRCCTNKYESTGVTAGNFFYNYMAFFERNPYFETMGAEIENAKIKYVTYKVTSDDQIVNSIKTGEIDYGEPTAKADNEKELGSFRQIRYLAGGYGYVGINPKFVEDITIRRAIMKAFKTGEMLHYYGDSLVNIITRPMSTTSWVWDAAYGHEGKLQDPYYEEAIDADEIIDFIEKDSNNNWQYKSGRWYYKNQVQTLKYNFTIAGESNDHPAYNMFVAAEELLEEAGFDITVGNDPKALQKLVTGDLAVWAAAWSSSIDPDPYQIYSIYSNASSTNNWYKDGIMDDATGKFAREQAIAQRLNANIIAGRESLDRRTRANIYAGDGYDGNGSCLDLIMELAVEFPTYQRYDLCVFDGSVLDEDTMHSADASFNMGPISELWKVNYVK